MVRLILGAAIGAAIGFAYYTFIGCSSGACPITSDPFISMVCGAMIGLLIAQLHS
jgi:hypothetical protein